ncbi:peptidase C14, caspase domain-containing protein, partial [Zopfochytrium polystomum]
MRRALFVGINYTGSAHPLSGCHRDVANMRAFLEEQFAAQQQQQQQHKGRGAVEIRVMTDAPENAGTPLWPGKANLLEAFKWLVDGACPGEHFFFHYSGHGGQAPDQDGDEDDGFDETILPVDFDKTGQIRDDDLHALLCAPLPSGSFLTSVFDCCHSGTMLDLPYTYVLGDDDEVVQISNFEAAGRTLLEGGLRMLKGDGKNGLAMAVEGIKLFLHKEGGEDASRQGSTGEYAVSKTARKITAATVIQWSGCKDDQTSADTRINGQPTGAMSWAFITAVKELPEGSYLQILRRVRQLLDGKYSQIPQISCGYEFNLTAKLIF